jgi:hypothetical protein
MFTSKSQYLTFKKKNYKIMKIIITKKIDLKLIIVNKNNNYIENIYFTNIKWI